MGSRDADDRRASDPSGIADPPQRRAGADLMSTEVSNGGDDPSFSAQDRIDEACDRFEAAWKAGERPRIENFLRADCPRLEHLALLRELLSIELFWRKKGGERPDPREYVDRFPDRDECVEVARAFMRADPALGRFTQLELHATGGLGAVFKARDEELNREVAVKRIQDRRAHDPQSQARFLREAEVTGQLEHPGIVPVYSLSRSDDGSPFYAMRFIRGETLQAAIARFHAGDDSKANGERTLAFRGLIRRFIDVCNTIGYAHSRGVLHRDIKPENIMLGPFGETLVVDWGLAKPLGKSDPASDTGERTLIPPAAAGGGETLPGSALGTPAYMSPEQAAGELDRLEPRSDVYSLGATLYCLLTGKAPFAGDRFEVAGKVQRGEFPGPRRVDPSIDPALEAGCLKAMALRPEDRHGSCRALAEDLERWMADEPVSAWREPFARRAWRWVRRNRTKVVAAAVLLVTATITLGISTVLVARERNEAEAQGRRARRAVHLLARGADIAFDDQLDPVQEEMLRDALEYYNEFTARSSNDPAVRLEHGRAYRQMGDIRRKLGRLRESEGAYLKAIGRLEPLADSRAVGREATRELAHTRTLLADLLIRRGADKGRAGGLYEQALEAQVALAGAGGDKAASAEDLLRLGQTLKSRGDLLRLDGRFREAGTAYDRAIVELERARSADAGLAEAPAALALAIDARGWIRSETGDGAGAEADFRRAVARLEELVAAFPTAPRYREALARALNSLALVEKATGRLADAEAHLRRELPLAERLSQDFPGRAEYRRALSRALHNLGIVLSNQRRDADAVPILRRAVEVAAALSAASPDDVQVRLDLVRDRIALGDILRQKGETPAAIAELEAARVLVGALIKEFPDRPRYRDLLAQDLVNLALARQGEPAKADELYRAAAGLFDELVAAYPENVDYRLGQATCLQNQGVALASAGQADRAAAAYRRALAQLDASWGIAASPQGMQVKALLLNNLGYVLQPTAPANAEVAFRQALGLFADLAARSSATLTDRHYLAIAEFNLGDTLRMRRVLPEAEAMLARAEADYEKLALAAPKSVDFRSQLGLVQSRKAAALAEDGKLAEAAAALAKAIAHQDRAVQQGKNRDDTRTLLGGHLLELAEVDLKRGAYQEAADNALMVPRAVPEAGRGEACFDAAKILARLVALVGADLKLVPADREQLIRPYLSRSIMLLRESLDSNPKMAERIKTDDAIIKVLESRPEFKMMMNSLVDLRR
jgi:serine/threonine-protein kinase